MVEKFKSQSERKHFTFQLPLIYMSCIASFDSLALHKAYDNVFQISINRNVIIIAITKSSFIIFIDT